MRCSETLAQALGQPFLAENEANRDKVSQVIEKGLFGTLSQAVPDLNYLWSIQLNESVVWSTTVENVLSVLYSCEDKR